MVSGHLRDKAGEWKIVLNWLRKIISEHNKLTEMTQYRGQW
jgi:hypothetical protein